MRPLTRWQKAKSALRAIGSGRDKKLQAVRDAICEKCPELTKVQQRNKWTGQIELGKFCKKCGCGIGGRIADMRSGRKNAWRKTACPLKKFPGDRQRDEDEKVLQLGDINWLSTVFDRLELDLATVQMHFDDCTMPDPQSKERLSGFPMAQHQLQQMLQDPVCLARFREMQQDKPEPVGTSRVNGRGTVKGIAAGAGDAAAAKEIPEDKFLQNFVRVDRMGNRQMTATRAQHNTAGAGI